jgi:hypothetical protein
MRCLPLVFLLAAACASQSPAPAGPIARLSVRAYDTIVVNRQQPTPLPVYALDAAGRAVSAAPIRFAQEDSAPLQVSETGMVTCSSRRDLTVRAAVGALGARLLVRCRPVQYLQLQGPMQFVLGDPELGGPMPLPLAAYDRAARPVVLIAGYADVGDTSVAVLRGLTLVPRHRGITGTFVRVGDRTARTGVHIYTRVASLAAFDTALRLPPEQRLLAVPLSLTSGEYHRQRIPRGSWMLTMLPEVPETELSPGAIRLRVEGAQCTPNLLNTPRRLGCKAGPDASLIVYRPLDARGPRAERADLLIRWLFM